MNGTTVQFEYSYEQRDRGWPNNPAVSKLRKMFDVKLPRFQELLRQLGGLEEHFIKIPLEAPASGAGPFWNNIWLPPLDAISLAGLVALRRPNVYIEVGSGNSTKFVRWMIEELGLPTRVISIDPFPRAEIDEICDVVVRSPFELVEQSIFHDLQPNDVVFIDNSHRSFPSSDVTVFFMEVLPSLQKGVLLGMHDIFLPFDYPMEWKNRFYNEQYLMACYLYGGGGGGEIVFATQYMCRLCIDECKAAFPRLVARGVMPTGGALWFSTCPCPNSPGV
jgi:hypothetical protein